LIVGLSLSYPKCKCVSRILSDADPFVGNQEFYRKLEGRLGGLIDSRSTQFFRVAAPQIARVSRASDSLDYAICIRA
jgi:hypothetical protein